MIDRITIVREARLRKRIGKLNDEDTVRLNRALTIFLGLARWTAPAHLRDGALVSAVRAAQN
jgi:hypothetical protein